MVYERYVKKNGKLHGPYYYESYRDEYGNVQKKYLGNELPQDKEIKKLKFYFYGVLFLGVFIFMMISLPFVVRNELVIGTFSDMRDLVNKGLTGFAVGERGIQATAVTECMNFSTDGEFYQLTADVSSNDTCFTVGGENISVDCQGHNITYTLTAPGYGFDNMVKYRNFSVRNCVIEHGNSDNPSSGGFFFTDQIEGLIYNNTMVMNGSEGIWFSYCGNINVSHNNISVIGLSSGIYNYDSHNNSFYGNEISSLDDKGIYIYGDSDHNIVADNIITNAGTYGVYLQYNSGAFTYPTLNNISGNSFYGSGTYDLFIENDDSMNGGTWLIDQIGKVNSYYFASAYLTIEESDYGNLVWINGMMVSEIGGNLSQNITIGNNSAFIISTDMNSLNQSVNVTFFNMGDRGYGNISILRDGSPCLDCSNFTALDANTVVFNVTGWSTYTIGEGSQSGEVISCENMTTRNSRYFLSQDISAGSKTCMIVGEENVTLDCRGHSISYATTGIGYGVDNQYGYRNLTVENCIIKQVDSSFTSSYGIYLKGVVEGGNVYNNTIITNGSSSMGIYAQNVNYTNITDNHMNTTGGAEGVFLSPAIGNIVHGNVISVIGGPNDAIYVYGDSDYNVISNNIITGSGGDGIELLNDGSGPPANYPNLNNVSGNRFDSGDITGYDIYVNGDDDGSVGGTWLIDQIGKVNSYKFGSAYLTIEESDYGKFVLINGLMVSEIGGNLSQNMTIGNASIFIISTDNGGLNKSANITFYNIGDRGYANPAVFRDGSQCMDCYNFTALDANTVVFNVTGWSNYTIENGAAANEIIVCKNLTTNGMGYVLTQDISASGTCLEVGAENVSVNCQGHKINYVNSVTGNGINNMAGYNNFSVMNCYIEQLNSSHMGDAIYVTNQIQGIFYNNTVITNGTSIGIWLGNSGRINMSDNNVSVLENFANDCIYIQDSSNNTLFNNIVWTNASEGIHLYGGSSFNVVNNNTFVYTGSDGIYVQGNNNVGGGSPKFNNLSSNRFLDVRGNDTYLTPRSDAGASAVWFIDQPSDSYEFLNAEIAVQDSVYGLIRWYTILSVKGINFSSEVFIYNNSVNINSTNEFLGSFGHKINISFFNFGDRGYRYPAVFKDGVQDLGAYNFTDLTANIVVFNVSSGGNYSIAAGTAPWEINRCKNLSADNMNYTLISDVNSNGTCFTVGGENISVDCQGYNITYTLTTQGYGFDNMEGYRNFSVRNCMIKHGNSANPTSGGFFLSDQIEGLIYNNTLTINGSDAIWLSYCGNINVSHNNISVSQTGNGIYTYNTHNSSFYGNKIWVNKTDKGIYIYGDSDYNVISDNTIYSGGTGIFLEEYDASNLPDYNNLSGNVLYSNSFNISSGGAWTWLIDQSVNSYRISGKIGLIDSNYGFVKFDEAISDYGANLSQQIYIGNNSFYRSAASGASIASGSNVTFYNMGNRSLTRPSVLKNGVNCAGCVNFTALDANTVKFNVLIDGNYTIGEWAASSSAAAAAAAAAAAVIGSDFAEEGELLCISSESCYPVSSCVNGIRQVECWNICTMVSYSFDMPCSVDLCVPNWQCSAWGVCVDGYAYRDCQDANWCGAMDNMPEMMLSCLPPKIEGEEVLPCEPNFVCGEWSGCSYSSQTGDVIGGKVKLLGLQERVCEDASQCAGNYIDTKPCTSEKTVSVKKTILSEDEGGFEGGGRSIVARDPKTNKQLFKINVESWKKEGLLDIMFGQGD